MKIFIILIICFYSSISYSFPIPKNNKASFDIIRKGKIIGNVLTTFQKDHNNHLTVSTDVNIEIKVLLVTLYDFMQSYQETWINNEFTKFVGHTKFEDEREYFINGEDDEKNFIAFGIDGDLLLDKNIIPLNYWNKDILKQEQVFDTQKGIVRDIQATKIKDEIILLNNIEINSEKYILNLSSHPKDRDPMPQYTLWYSKKGELLKFTFKPWRDRKTVTTQRNDGSFN